MKNIVIAGSINMDIVINLDKYPEKGETVSGEKISFIPGGKGANEARQIARLGKKVTLIGKVGSDDFGKTLIQSLAGDGVDTKEIQISKKDTSGISTIGVDKKAENRIIYTPGANFDLTPSDIKHNFRSGDFALSHFEIPTKTADYLFSRAKKANAKTILNPSPIHQMTQEFLEKVDYLIINEHEFTYLSKEKPKIDSKKLTRTANKLLRGKNQVMVVTLGQKGSLAIQGSKVIKAEAFKVKARDTTGAGDSFLGSFCVALSEGKTIENALRFGNAAAALKVTKLGASSMPFRDEVEKLLETAK